jgi:hypothetical protein
MLAKRIILKPSSKSTRNGLSGPMRHRVESRYLERRKPYERTKDRSFADETITERLMQEYDKSWDNMMHRLRLVPGKEVLAHFNSYLQTSYGITITPVLIIDSYAIEEIDEEVKELIGMIDNFSAHRTE